MCTPPPFDRGSHADMAPPQGHRPGRHPRGGTTPGADPELAAPGCPGDRRHRWHRHLHADRRRRQPRRSGRPVVVPGRGRGLRLRGARVRRDGDDDAGRRQRLHVQLHRAGRDDRLGRRLEPDPRILAGGERGGGRLVRLRGGLPQGPGRRPPVVVDGRPACRRTDQPAGGCDRVRGGGDADGGDARKRDVERGPGGVEDHCAGDVRRDRAAAFDAANTHPFMPFGFAKSMGADGVERGVMAAAAIIFFAFYGFDAISTAAEETKNPARDLSIGIVGSMVGCTLIYMLVALAAVGAMKFTVFGHSPEPLALILRELGQGKAATLIAAAAVIALPTVLLAFLYGQSRIFFVMSRDGLLPRGLSKVNARTGTPIATTLFTAVLVAALAGVARLDEIAALANAGTLAAFIAVAVCLLVLRKRHPDRTRVFRAPMAWVVGPIAILGCLYLFWSLPQRTQLWFLAWNAIGVLAYLFYGRRASLLARGQAA